MKKYFYLIIIAFIIVNIGNAQNITNIYADKENDTAAAVPKAEFKDYDGEYQWALDNDFHWSLVFDNLARSFRIEVVSFPFVINDSMTQGTPQLDRLLSVPESMDSNGISWDYGYAPKRILTTGDTGTVFVNYQATLHSNCFTSNVPSAGSGDFIPHTVLKHTLYLHCGETEESPIIDSLIFIADLTRGRMRYYPFVNGNHYDGITSGSASHDIIPYIYFDYSNSYEADDNFLNTVNYYPIENNFSCDSETAYPTDLSDTNVYYLKPPPYSLYGFHVLDATGAYPAGYQSGDTSILKKMPGVKHDYFIDHNIDLTQLNPWDRKIYNPSEVHITADSLIFPSGYTFQTVRGIFPTESEVLNSSICPDKSDMDVREILVPTDLDTSVYYLEAGSKLIIEPCVYIYDARFIVDTGATLVYTSDQIYGNYEIVDNGGAIINNSSNSLSCNNCGCVQEFDVTPSFEGDAPYSFVISDTQYWSGEKLVKGRISIEDGGVLFLNDATLKFADSKRLGYTTDLAVAAGGKLIMNNSTLTVLDCDNMWDGLQVNGTYSQPQGSWEYYDAHQGVLIMDSSTIEHARIGIYAGKKDYSNSFFGFGGGMVKVQNSTIKDCAKGVSFDLYKRFKSNSLFKNNVFISTRNLRDNKTYPSTGTYAFVELNRINDIEFISNSFLNENEGIDSLQLRPVGIVAYGACFDIDGDTDHPSKFTNLYKGIDAYRFHSVFNRMSITNAVFDNVLHGITVYGGNYDYIANNTFKNIPPNAFTPSVKADSWGIFMKNAQRYMVGGNSFSGATQTHPVDYHGIYGVIASHSKSGGGEINYNSFEQMDIGVQTEDDNHRLRLGCNSFATQADFNYSVAPPFSYDNSLLPEKLGDQGYECLEATAGDQFLDTCNVNPATHIRSNVFFTYFAHGDYDPNDIYPDSVCSSYQTMDIEYCDNEFLENTWCSDVEDLHGRHIVHEINEDNVTQLAQYMEAYEVEDDMHHDLGTVLRYLAKSDSLEMAIAFLELMDGDVADPLLVPLYLEDGAYQEAGEALDRILPVDDDEEAWVDYHRLILDMEQHEDDWRNLDAGKINELEDFRESGYGISIMAASILASAQDSLLTLYPDKWDAEAYKWQEEEETIPVSKWNVYPNPSDGQITIEAANASRIQFYNLSGQPVLNGNLKKGRNHIDASQLPAGLYILKYSLPDGTNAFNRVIISK